MWAIYITAPALFHAVQALWPVPSSVSLGSTVLKISPDLEFWREFAIPDLPFVSHKLVDDAITRTRTLFHDGFVPWMLSGPGEPFEPTLDQSVREIKRVTLVQKGADHINKTLIESYSIDITLDGTVNITAEHSAGLLYGLNTLAQLFYTSSEGNIVYTKYAPAKIMDAPVFPWRGLNLDVARAYIPVQMIEQVIETMSWNKMNRLHLHVTDAQSWPLVIPSMPGLSSKGSFYPDAIYTAGDFTRLQEYASDRGIQIVTEIDMPGHTASISQSQPDLITGYNVQTKSFFDSTIGDARIDTKDWSAYCAEPPCGQLKLGSSQVDSFLEKLLNDVLPRVRNYTTYFHAGGDEVNKNVYLLQEGLSTNSTSILQPLVAKLVLSVHDQIRKHGLIPIAWEEMLLDWNITLGKDVVVQSWISADSIKKITSMGYKVIAGSSSSTYLDCGRGQWLDFTADAVSYQQSQGFVDYCNPFKNWRTIYTYDPLFNLTQSEAKLVQGLEVHAWAEQIDTANLETMIWPRAAAAAEVGWSGSDKSKLLEEAGSRLSEWRERMVHRGVRVDPIHSLWCTQRPGQCSL